MPKHFFHLLVRFASIFQANPFKYLRAAALLAALLGVLILFTLPGKLALLAGTTLLAAAGLICWLGMDFAESNAHHQAAHLAAVLNNISDGVLTLDEQGDFVSANPALLKMIPEDRLKEINTSPLEATLQWQRAVFSVRAAPVDEAGSVVIFHNETRRHETEQAKDALLATVSHELRTPLSAITNYLELLLMLTENGKMDTARFTEHLKRAIENSNRLLRLINAMLDQAQLQTGAAQPKQQAFNLLALLEKTLDLMEARITKKQLLFELKTARNVPAEIIGDPDQLRKVLVNVLDNAIKFTERGSIRVRVSLPNKEMLCIEVTDTGPGIAAEQLPDIFEAFRRGGAGQETSAERSATSAERGEHQGAGLGLSVAKQLVTNMGGQISVVSTLDVGSTFTICLPLEGVTRR